MATPPVSCLTTNLFPLPQAFPTKAFPALSQLKGDLSSVDQSNELSQLQKQLQSSTKKHFKFLEACYRTSINEREWFETNKKSFEYMTSFYKQPTLPLVNDQEEFKVYLTKKKCHIHIEKLQRIALDPRNSVKIEDLMNIECLNSFYRILEIAGRLHKPEIVENLKALFPNSGIIEIILKDLKEKGSATHHEPEILAALKTSKTFESYTKKVSLEFLEDCYYTTFSPDEFPPYWPEIVKMKSVEEMAAFFENKQEDLIELVNVCISFSTPLEQYIDTIELFIQFLKQVEPKINPYLVALLEHKKEHSQKIKTLSPNDLKIYHQDYQPYYDAFKEHILLGEVKYYVWLSTIIPPFKALLPPYSSTSEWINTTLALVQKPQSLIGVYLKAIHETYEYADECYKKNEGSLQQLEDCYKDLEDEYEVIFWEWLQNIFIGNCNFFINLINYPDDTPDLFQYLPPNISSWYPDLYEDLSKNEYLSYVLTTHSNLIGMHLCLSSEFQTYKLFLTNPQFKEAKKTAEREFFDQASSSYAQPYFGENLLCTEHLNIRDTVSTWVQDADGRVIEYSQNFGPMNNWTVSDTLIEEGQIEDKPKEVEGKGKEKLRDSPETRLVNSPVSETNHSTQKLIFQICQSILNCCSSDKNKEEAKSNLIQILLTLQENHDLKAQVRNSLFIQERSFQAIILESLLDQENQYLELLKELFTTTYALPINSLTRPFFQGL